MLLLMLVVMILTRGAAARSSRSRAPAPPPPSLFPLKTCGADSAPWRAVGCLATGYFPSPVDYSWASATPPIEGTALIPEVRARSGLFSSGSSLRLPATPSGPQSFTCSIRHAATNTKKSIQVSPAAARAPTVDVFQACSDGGVVELMCLVSGFAPAPVSVTWLMDGQPLDHAHTEPAAPGDAPGTFRVVSRVNVSLGEWRDESFSCRVAHAASSTVREAPARRCSAQSSSPIRVFAVPPSPSELYISQSPKLLCLVTSLPSDEGLAVTWARAAGGALEPLPLRLSHQYNGTFTATSELPLATRDWESGAAFVCRVSHAELPAPVERRVERRQGKRLPPSVFLLPPPPEEVSSSRPTLSLTCLARGFFPDAIDVQWQRDQESIGAGDAGDAAVQTGPVRREKGGEGSYFLYSRLEVERAEWERGSTFVCTVVHEGLPLRFVQRSVHRNPGN